MKLLLILLVFFASCQNDKSEIRRRATFSQNGPSFKNPLTRLSSATKKEVEIITQIKWLNQRELSFSALQNPSIICSDYSGVLEAAKVILSSTGHDCQIGYSSLTFENQQFRRIKFFDKLSHGNNLESYISQGRSILVLRQTQRFTEPGKVLIEILVSEKSVKTLKTAEGISYYYRILQGKIIVAEGLSTDSNPSEITLAPNTVYQLEVSLRYPRERYLPAAFYVDLVASIDQGLHWEDAQVNKILDQVKFLSTSLSPSLFFIGGYTNSQKFLNSSEVFFKAPFWFDQITPIKASLRIGGSQAYSAVLPSLVNHESKVLPSFDLNFEVTK